MRFPSLNLVAASVAAVVRRFPWSVAAAAVCTVTGLLLVDSDADHEGLLRWMAAGTLGLSLLTGLALAGERGSPRTALLLPPAGVAVLAAVFLLWPGWSEPVQLRRYLQLSLGFHLIVAWLPYAAHAEPNGFWQYNRSLFLRFLLGLLYSVVLFVGLSVALLALDHLFGLDVDEDVYFRLWILVAFAFHPLFFLGGLPASFLALEADTRYPTGLKVFSQFILLPIVVLYLVILTAYMAKVAATQEWPSGWIGYLVSSVAVVGILSLLLVHPVKERAENRWVKTYGRWFYIALFPSIVMLLLAVWKRIDQYGITENRYFLVVLSLWLAGIAIYFTLSRGKNIKLIPLSLCVLAFATSLGPWGAYAVSERSQFGRLEHLLRGGEMLAGTDVHAPPEPLSVEERRELSAVLRYLVETHGRDAVLGRLAWPAVADTARDHAVAEARALLQAVDVVYEEPRPGGDERYFHLYTALPAPGVAIGGYDYAVRVDAALPAHATVGPHELEFRLEQDPPVLLVQDGSGREVRLSLQPVLARAEEQRLATGGRHPSLEEPMLLTGEAEGIRVLARILGANGEFEGDALRLRSLQSDVFVSFEAEPER